MTFIKALELISPAYGQPKAVEITYDGSVTLRALLASITDATVSKPYIVYLPAGTYDIASMFTVTELSAAVLNGLAIPDYVTLVGIGSRENVILDCVLSAPNSYISTIHLERFPTYYLFHMLW